MRKFINLTNQLNENDDFFGGLIPIGNAPKGWLTDRDVADQFIPLKHHENWFELFGRGETDLIGTANAWFKEIGINARAWNVDEESSDDGYYWKID